MIRRIAAAALAAVLILTGLTACGGREPVPEIPPERQLPGDLAGVIYETGGGMAARTEFHIRLNREEIESAAFWPVDEYAEEIREVSHRPISGQQWQALEELLLYLYGDWLLEEYAPAQPVKPKEELLILDGGDYTRFALIWDTAEGPVETGYYFPSGRYAAALLTMLEELADPQGREIPDHGPRLLSEIWFTRKHRLFKDRDYSYQFHYTSYDETDPHWELIYYLGEYGAVGRGTIRLEQSDWEAFLALAQELQLEYFPKTARSDRGYFCSLSYNDGSGCTVTTDQDTEQRLCRFFETVIEEHP